MRYAILTVLCATLMSPVIVGCDKEVSHTESSTKNPVTGTTTTKDQTTYQRSDGSTYTQSCKTTNTNPNP